MSDRTGAKVYMKKSTHLFNDYFNALLSFGLSVAMLFADSVLRDQLLTNYSLRAASVSSLWNLKPWHHRRPTTPECPFPGSGQCYHGIRQKTRFQAGWADRFEGMLTIAALSLPSDQALRWWKRGQLCFRARWHQASFTLAMAGRTRTGAWWTHCAVSVHDTWDVGVIRSRMSINTVQFQTLNNIVQLPNIRDLLLSPFFFTWTEPPTSTRKINCNGGSGTRKRWLWKDCLGTNSVFVEKI